MKKYLPISIITRPKWRIKEAKGTNHVKKCVSKDSINFASSYGCFVKQYEFTLFQ